MQVPFLVLCTHLDLSLNICDIHLKVTRNECRQNSQHTLHNSFFTAQKDKQRCLSEACPDASGTRCDGGSRLILSLLVHKFPAQIPKSVVRYIAIEGGLSVLVGNVVAPETVDNVAISLAVRHMGVCCWIPLKQVHTSCGQQPSPRVDSFFSK